MEQGPPASAEEAQRMAQTFVEVYEVTLISIERHLEKMIREAGPEFAGGYKPWQNALHELVEGTKQLAEKKAPENPESLGEALILFSFDSGTRFLQDECIIIGINTERSWREKFAAHIEMMMSTMGLRAYPVGV